VIMKLLVLMYRVRQKSPLDPVAANFEINIFASALGVNDMLG
jgi:hypothetical protein